MECDLHIRSLWDTCVRYSRKNSLVCDVTLVIDEAASTACFSSHIGKYPNVFGHWPTHLWHLAPWCCATLLGISFSVQKNKFGYSIEQAWTTHLKEPVSLYRLGKKIQPFLFCWREHVSGWFNSCLLIQALLHLFFFCLKSLLQVILHHGLRNCCKLSLTGWTLVTYTEGFF